MASVPASRFAHRLNAIGGETGPLMAQRDWSASSLGSPDTWPQSLRSVVGLLLGSKFPMFVAWGDELNFLYNDAYAEILGNKHPNALGAPFRDVWSEIWPDISPLIDAALAGEASYHEDLPLVVNRKGYDEQAWFTFSYSPVHDESGSVAGMFCAVAETTGKVLADQRQNFVVSLGDTLANLTDPAAITATAAELLGYRLGVGRAGYGEIDPSGEIVSVARDWTSEAMVSLAGEARVLDAFGPEVIAELRAGRTLVVEDCLTDPRACRPEYLTTWESIGTRALIVAPLVSEGRLVAILYVHSSTPRTWSDLEALLVQDVGGRTWAAVERARAEAALRESEAQQAFLLSLSDAIRPLRTPAEIAAATAERLAERFDLNRVFYAEMVGSLMTVERDHTRGVSSIAGEHDLKAFGPELLRTYASSPVVKVEDVCTDERLGQEAKAGLRARQVRAFLDVVLFEDEQRVGLLALQSAKPRTWTGSEEALFRGAGERVKTAIDRARADDQLRELNETLEAQVAERTAALRRYHDIVDATVAPICAFDTDCRLIAFNRAHNDEFRRVNGFDTRIGDVFPDLFVPEQGAKMHALMKRALLGETFTVVEQFGRPELGTPCWEITYTPLRDESGRVVGAFHHAVDISEQLVAQAELDAAQEALRQSQKMEAMGQLTGGVAHDFNNLLTPIVGSLDMLQRKQLGGEREQRLVAGAMQSAERAKTLVQRLLAFARRQPLQPVPVDVASLVNGMGELIASTTGPQIKVLVEAPEGLLPAKADPNQLEMALLNLAVNARDAMAEGGGTLRISTVVEDVRTGHRTNLRPGSYLCLSVADTGAGMDDATIARAVEPFFSTKGVGKGTGLGLSMVHGLASQLGGALTIQSQPRLGTNVELWLPCTGDGPRKVEPLATTEMLTTRGTALLVDDEELVRMSTADMLIDLGYAVVEAASAEEALRVMKDAGHIDLLVTDHLMPGMSGTELAREVRAATPGLPVLLVSGYAERKEVDPGLPRLTKPFRKDELASSLAQIIPLS